jgi:hypothetical protein
MRLILLAAALALLSAQASGELGGTYSVVVDGNGTAVVTLVVTGMGTINVPLPVDVTAPAVRDALYVKSSNGVDVSVDAAGQSTILYRTDLLTFDEYGISGGNVVKAQSTRFRMELPGFNTTTVMLYVPEDVEVLETRPQAAVSHVGLSQSILWVVRPSENPVIEAEYRVQEAVPAGGGGVPYLSLFVAVAVLAVVAVGSIYLKRRGGK